MRQTARYPLRTILSAENCHRATADWQCAVGTIVPKESGKTIRRIIVYCAFDHNSGTARFDNLSLRQEPVQTYSYNADGNVTAATQTGTGTEKAGYTGTDLTSYTAANGAKYTYTYNAAHDVTSASVAGIKSTTTYNEAGNVTGSKLTSTEKNEQKYLESSAVATPDRNHTQRVTDVNGNETLYDYNSLTEQLLQTKDALKRETNYTYDANSRRTTMVYRHGVAAIDYGYENGRLATLDRKTYRSGTAQHQIYSFGYNQWGQATSTSVGNLVLSTNDYAPRGGNLTQTTYANGVAVTYSYDLLDRLVEKSYHETGKPDFTIRYTYNAESQLARLRYEEDGETVGSYAFEYDSLGRLIRSTAMDENGSVTQRTEHLYDAFNRLSGQSWTLGAQTYSERYAYSDGEKGDGSLTSMTAATGDSLSFGYDTLKRLNRVTAKSGSSIIMNTAYAYRDVSWNRGSAQVEFRNVRLGSDSGMLLEGKKYSYDKAGNLVMISESTGDFNKLVEYAYDSQNQLTSEAYYKSGEAEAYITYNYTYDTAGNLLTVSQKKGNTTTLLQTYTYSDAQWHDLLTAVNGQAITYDASGNPLSYGGWSFGWQNGRQLKTASKTSDGKTETLEYSYDADGIRTSKTYTVETFTQVPDYTVTFQADGATVKTMTVEDGYTLKDSDYPAVPTKTGYTGEWVKYTSAIHSNVTVQAKYAAVVAKYTVTFKADNTVVKTMTVKDGYTLKASDYPTVPAKSGYTGEWVKYTAAIHSNITVQAKYTAVVTRYTVFFKADGFTVKAIQVSDGYILQDADYPEVPAKVGCNGAWEKHTAAIHSNVTINAVYSPIASHYTVTFKANGKTLKTMTVADGYVLKTSDYPTIPKRAGYTGSWPKTGAIHANTTITAVYTKDSGIVIPTQPTSPGEIMSGGEGEPVEADVPAEDETVSPQGTHVTGTQTVTHEYLTLNGKVARETIKTNNSLTAVLDFIYDESGKPFALKYSTNGTSFQTYYYVLNLQGDVVKLIHYIPGFEYESVATYEYDAWGNIVSSSGRLAEINPLRYRGYYYDNETGFYYLQSRYYDPANRRFINADTYSSTDPGDAIGCNMFAYCGNNPVMRNDYSGDAWWHWVVATVAVVGLAVASVVTCGGAAAAAMTATALISGTCTTVPAAATIITGAALGAGVAYAGSVVSAASSVKSTEEFAEYGKSALISTVAGAVVGAVAGAINAATSCFVAGTPVLTEDGDKPIEDVTVGDYVWAWDEATGTTELKQVVETYVNETSELMHIFVNGEEIVATPTHPFYCPVKGWTDAAHLRAGDILVLVNGEYVVVEKIQHELLENPVKVYNFQVQDYHTYYVAESGVLVHNTCEKYGQGHGNKIHAKRIDDKLTELQKSGQYTEVYGNRSLNTAGLNGNQRPDIIAKGTSGIYEVWEFASPSQASGAGFAALANKVEIMKAANPGVIFHDIIPW